MYKFKYLLEEPLYLLMLDDSLVVLKNVKKI